MKFLLATLGLTYSLLCIAQLDTSLLGTSLNDTFLNTLKFYEFLEDDTMVSRIKIDKDYTDFNLGYVKANLTTQTIPLASNLNDNLLFALNFSTNASTINDEEKSFNFNANINIQSNTLAVLKHISLVSGVCEQEPINDETLDRVHIQNIICYIQEGINNSNSVTKLQDGFKKAAAYGKRVYVNDSKKNSDLKNLFSSLTITPNKKNLVLTFIININNLFTKKNKKNNDNFHTVLTLKEKSLNLSLKGKKILKNKEFKKYIDLIKNTALELQNKESNLHITYYEDNLYLFFNFLEAFLISEE